MALTLTLRFIAQPSPGDVLAYVLRVNSAAVSTVAKTFGTDIVIGATLEETALNTYNALVSGTPVAGVDYSQAGAVITLEFEGFGITTVTGSVIESIEEIITEDPGLVPFDLLDLSIEIIDTYTNARPLIEEFTQLNAPRLIWDAGDDLYQPMMPSKLTFNILDETAADGRFLHLLTGDEQRYKVKIHNTDAGGVQTLLWQGFILPDLYSEPYKNGSFFVEFTAIDMLSSLKGKVFEPWFYYQTFPMPVFFAYILQQTGIIQELYVSPALVNVRPGGFEWRKLTVPMAGFNAEKQGNLYDMLERVLIAQGLQILSYRGKWILQGLTRKAELTGDVEVYHPDGVYKQTVLRENTTVTPLFAAELPVVTAETPWKKVNLNFQTDSPANLFVDDVVVRDYFATKYNNGTFMLPTFTDVMFDYWQVVGSPQSRMYIDKMYLRYALQPGVNYHDYYMSEASAQANYFECKQKPFAAVGRQYELEMEVLVFFEVTFIGNIQERVEGGTFDFLLTFQMFQNGTEIISNRPSFPSASDFRFIKTWEPQDPYLPGANFAAYFKIKKEFTVQQNGNITFRFLPPLGPIFNSWTGEKVVFFAVEPKVLKINLLDEYAAVESGIAVRDINFTREIDVAIDFTSSPDGSVVNNFGISQRLFSQYTDITVGEPEAFVDFQVFPPSTTLQLDIVAYPISSFDQDVIFKLSRKKSLFLQKPDGSREWFYSVYTHNQFGVNYLGFLQYYPGHPKIPKDYKTHDPFLPGEVLRIMNSYYQVENSALREYWKIYGFPDESARSYLKTLAYAYHAVRPQTSFSIDTEALALVFPLQLVQFKYLGDRLYTPTRLELNLATGKTQLTMKEALLSELTDITYE